jgi:undecaprenyl-diphosphatase
MSAQGAGQRATASGAPRGGYVAANLMSWTAALVRPARRSRRLVGYFGSVQRRLVGQSLLVVAAVVASILWLDGPALELVRRLPAWVILLFEEITDFGRSGWILIPVGLLVLATAAAALPALDRISQAVLAALAVRLGFVFIAVGLPGLVFTILKRWIGRFRPSQYGPLAFDPFSWRSEYASLPSGHTVTAFAALVALGMLFPRARPALWAYALLIGLSRVIVAAHYPSDVIAGAAAGALGAVLVREWFVARRLGFSVDAQGRAHVYAGPSLARLKKVARAVFSGARA